MIAGAEQAEKTIDWSDDGLELRIDVDRAGTARIARLRAPTPPRGPDPADQPEPIRSDAALPLLDVVLAGEGRGRSGGRYGESPAGRRFRYADHTGCGEPASDGWRELRVDLHEPVTGLRAAVFYRVLDGRGSLRSWVRIENEGPRPVTLQSVTSFLCGGLADPDDPEDLDLLWAENDWLAESRWQRRTLRDALPDLDRGAHGGDPRGRFGLTSLGTWSSGTYLPMGAVVNGSTGHAWAWQIEHNGGWHWQVGERGAAGGVYVALLGPTDPEHHWRVTLAPGESFTTVPVTVAVSGAGFDGAVAALTASRRASRRRCRSTRRRRPRPPRPGVAADRWSGRPSACSCSR